MYKITVCFTSVEFQQFTDADVFVSVTLADVIYRDQAFFVLIHPKMSRNIFFISSTGEAPSDAEETDTEVNQRYFEIMTYTV